MVHCRIRVPKAPFLDGTPSGVAATAAAALIVGLLLSPVLARLLPFGLDGRLPAASLEADR
jgi:hypothetical protein